MKKGFTALVDKQGNTISARDDKVDRLIKNGYRRVSDPPKLKTEPKPKTTGSE